MFGMNGFHASASGAIHGHHGPLVFNKMENTMKVQRTENAGNYTGVCFVTNFANYMM